MSDTKVLNLRFGSFELDEANARLTSDGQLISLTPKVFGVLCELARRPGQLMTKEALLEAVWGHQHVSESTLKTIISQLRTALSDDAKQPRYIETASRRGYRFIGVGSAGQMRAGLSEQAPLVHTGLRPSESHPVGGIIGREAAVGRLRAAWNETVQCHPQFPWINGQAGIGETTGGKT